MKYMTVAIIVPHERQKQETWIDTFRDGVRLGAKYTPIQRVGVYVPGGTAAYPSTVLMDTTPAHEQRGIFIDVVKAVAEEINIPFTIGGGIRTIEDFRQVLLAGADKVSVNSAAVLRPELIREAAARFGNQCVVLSIDAKRNNRGSWDVYVEGGRKNTEIDAIAWAKQGVALGAGEICINSIDADGEKKGFDLELNRRLAIELPVPIIASGGAGTMRWTNTECFWH